jgi:hypothetical protein
MNRILTGGFLNRLADRLGKTHDKSSMQIILIIFVGPMT